MAQESGDVQHRPWERLVYARDQIEAMMIESYIGSQGIETNQPFRRHLLYDTGMGPGVAGEPGIRIDVPASDLERARALLAEKMASVKAGHDALRDDGAPSMPQEHIERVIARHAAGERAPRPAAGAASQTRVAPVYFPGLVLILAGLFCIATGTAQYFDAQGTHDELRTGAGVFLVVIGMAMVASGALVTKRFAVRVEAEAPREAAASGRWPMWVSMGMMLALLELAAYLPSAIYSGVSASTPWVPIPLLEARIALLGICFALIALNLLLWRACLRELRAGLVSPARPVFRLIVGGFATHVTVFMMMAMLSFEDNAMPYVAPAIFGVTLLFWRALLRPRAG